MGSRILMFSGLSKYRQNISPDKTFIIKLFKNFYQVMYFANEYSIGHTCRNFDQHLFQMFDAQVR